MEPPQIFCYDTSNRLIEKWKLFSFYFVFHFILTSMLIGYACVVAPYFQNFFRDFRVPLPSITEWMLYFFDLTDRWYGWCFFFAFAAGWSAAIAMCFVRSEGSQWKRRFLIHALILVYLMAGITFVSSLVLPYLKLWASVISGAP